MNVNVRRPKTAIVPSKGVDELWAVSDAIAPVTGPVMHRRWPYLGCLLAHHLLVLLTSAGLASGYAPPECAAEAILTRPVWWRSEARRAWTSSR